MPAKQDSAVEPPEARLRAAREAADISIDEVAEKLHLDRSIILALEEGDFARLGAPVFVKGHVRSYARLLGLPEDELTDSLRAEEPEPEEFRTLSVPTTVRQGANLSNFLLWVLLSVIVLVGAIYLLVGDDEPEPSDFVTPVEVPEAIDEQVPETLVPETVTPEALPEQPKDVAPEDFAVNAAVEAVPAKLPPEQPLKDAPAPVVAVSETLPAAGPEESAPVPAPATVALTLRFSEECWVEISGAQRRLVYGLEKAGSVRNLRGVPPFKLFFGNTNAVELEIAGKEYTIPRSVRMGRNTARFVIDAALIERVSGQ